MQAFAAVVDSGSFVRGADALQLSKSVISRLVADLEARLGVRLLQRTTRRLSLTPEGQVFLERCRHLLADVNDAEAEVTRHAGEVIGELRVSAPVSFGLQQLAPLWPAFMARHPQLLLDVTLADRFVDLVDEGYDMALRIARLPASSLVCRQLASTRLVLCASPQYLQQHGELNHIDELAGRTVFAYKLLSTGDQWHFTGPKGPVSVKVTPRMRSNSGDSCVQAALQHQGLVLQPSFLVGEPLRLGRLVEVLPQYRSIELGIYAVYPSRKQLAPKVRRLVDFLVESFRTPAWPA
ncbi:LysR family transcriptional regulator [Pelomonas sp. UHG3]|uniref:LysR family transcriptional regulator n=1 Tax=Roseateles hydrophilus TaxID=2975054 RepID=A0ACC6CEN6_9BURK|nr:LysR family transcriptional regulator [Pelomonas sp. UHG3]MCY4746739.1 LysR family transcriptional regulator [Pelomonas sp. UHG3]